MATNERIKWHTITVENRSNGWERGLCYCPFRYISFSPCALISFWKLDKDQN